MATVNGTSGDDLIHVAGDGHIASGSQVDNPSATDLADTIDPGTGNDSVFAGGGDDIINFGANLTASDAIDGGDGADTVTLNGAYNVTFAATTMVNVENIVLSSGHDYSLSLAEETIAAGQTMTVDGSALGASNRLVLNTFRDTDGRLVATGGAGNDNLFAGSGNSTLHGGAGDDQLTVNDVSNSINILDGGDGNDTLTGYYGNETMTGGAGNDWIRMLGPGGTATIDGGDGNDTVDLNGTIIHDGGLVGGKGTDRVDMGEITLAMPLFSAASSGFEIMSRGGGSVEAHGDDNNNVFDFSGFTMIFSSNVQLDGAGGDDVLTGNTTDDALTGGSGDDILNGGDGNDSLIGGAGANVLNGGAGNDTLRYDSNFQQTAPESDTMNGADGNDTVFAGHNGTYEIDTGAGDDSVDLEGTTVTEGNLRGGTGNDTLHLVGAVLAVARFDTSESGFERLATGFNSCSGDGNANIIDFSGFALPNSSGVSIDGAGGDNSLIGTANDDSLTGGPGNDHLNGGHGNDIMMGGGGNDVYQVLDVGDVVVESAGKGIDAVHTKLNAYTLGDNVENLTFKGNKTFAGTGNDLDNKLVGGDGSDVLEGKGGADRLAGGAGTDIFKFDSVADSTGGTIDRLLDLDGGTDKIQLWFSISAFDGTISAPSLKALGDVLDADHFGAHEAALVALQQGHQQTYLVVDADGVAGYQAGSDLLILVNGTNFGQIGIASFV